MDIGQVFTKRNIADFMVSLFSLHKDATILDPCFGTGVFLEALTNQGFKNIAGYEIDSSLYEICKNYKDCKLYNSDFLSAPTNKYDGIIMNPPYVRQEKIDDLFSFGITKKELKKNPIFSRLPNNANLYMYFILKAISLLRVGGELIVIFPNTWLKAKNGCEFKNLILSDCGISQQFNITGNVFEKNALVDVLILKIKKGNMGIQPIVQNLYYDGQNFIEKKVVNEMVLDFNLPFTSIATAKRGLTTGYNEMFINPSICNNDESFLTPIITSPKAIKGFSTKDAKQDYLLTIRKNIPDSVLEYLALWKEKIIDKKSPKTLYNSILNGKDWYKLKLISSESIIFSYFIRKEIKFIYNKFACQVRDNFYIIKSKISDLLLFALLNNYYIFYQLECYGKRYGKGLLKIQRYDLERINFPDINCFDDKDIHELENLSLKLIETNNSKIINSITKLISKYSSIGYDKILNQYNALKKERLEDTDYD